jgi:hypothetical protein
LCLIAILPAPDSEISQVEWDRLEEPGNRHVGCGFKWGVNEDDFRFLAGSALKPETLPALRQKLWVPNRLPGSAPARQEVLSTRLHLRFAPAN